MLADVQTIRKIVKATVDMTADGIYRRMWADKPKDKTSELRYNCFRFWDATEADMVASVLQSKLVAQGYTNKVVRTTVDSSWETHTTGGEYVRVTSVA